MILAFICPDSYDDYDRIELELEKYEDVSKILCATSHSYSFIMKYADKSNIEYHREKCSGKEEPLRRIVKAADKVIVFQQENRDKTKYSRTEVALKFTEEFNKNVELHLC